MGDRRSDLLRVLTEVRRRCNRRSFFRAWTFGAAVACVPLLAGLGIVLSVAGQGWPLVGTLTFIFTLAGAALVRALWPLRSCPTELQLARLVEERVGGMDDVLVTAVASAGRPGVSPRMGELLASDALRSMAGVDLDRVISRSSLRKLLLQAAAATAVLAAVLAVLAPATGRASRIVAGHLFPARFELHVLPGSAKIRAGTSFTVTARVAGAAGAIVPTLMVGAGDAARAVPMSRGPGEDFIATLESVDGSFPYSVIAAATRSEEYVVDVVHPPKVERIDLQFEYPAAAKLPGRTERDGGDIYGPAGTRVRVSVTADKPLARGHLVLADGTKVSLDGSAETVNAALTIRDDSSYRIALTDLDGLEGGGDVEYFIRTLLDRPPDVHVLRPGGDRQVTPLEEVLIQAQAEDDFGVASLDLVFQTPGGRQKALPLSNGKGALSVEGARTLFLEDLGVAPGDFVTYYARARDVGQGRQSVESRSDIFFLEVKPFEEEFVSAQSQAMSQAGGPSGGLQELAEAQKEIIIATWKLDARARRAGDGRSVQDIRALATAQSALKGRAEQAGGNAAIADPRRRRGAAPRPGLSTTSANPMGQAIEAMGLAAVALADLKTSAALPHEMEALNQLLKAAADMKRRQVARQQQAGGGGGSNRSGPDLSTLFDQELRRRQETNYEQPSSSETREDEPNQEDPLEKVRELARRQEAQNRDQQELSRQREQITEEELKRRLERLTREQNELRQEADQLARQMQQQSSSQSQRSPSSQNTQGSSQGQSGAGSRESGRQRQQATGGQLREASEQMRQAATDLRKQNPEQASANGSRALEQLRDTERQLQVSRPDDRRRALGDLQLETRQLADAVRRLGNEAARTAPGRGGQDARRRLAGEQDRLADRVDRLREGARRMADGNQGTREEQRAVDEAARELDRQRLAERMRQTAEGLRQQASPGSNGQAPAAETGSPAGTPQLGHDSSAARSDEQVARSLDQVAERLAEAAGSESAQERRLSDQLGKAQELRRTLDELQQSMEGLRRQGNAGERQQTGDPGAQGQPGSQTQGQQGGQRGQTQGQQAQGQGQAAGSPSSSERAQGQDGQAGSPSAGGQSGPGGGTTSVPTEGGDRAGGGSRNLDERMRDAERQVQELRRENQGLQAPQGEEGWWRSRSAPGTEGFKQDFAKWESLRKNLLSALERVESDLSDRLRARENSERLNAGRHEAVPEAYREYVDRYYQSLATPRKPQ